MNACPFCGDLTGGQPCATCGRVPSAPRRPCPACKNMTPLNEPVCSHCGVKIRSEMHWKIPMIIAMFVAAFVAAIAVQLAFR